MYLKSKAITLVEKYDIGEARYGKTSEYKIIPSEEEEQKRRDFDRWKHFNSIPFENYPRTGYVIKSRDISWGRPNDSWGVELPGTDGVTISLPHHNIAYLLRNASITAGIIENPCVWVREKESDYLVLKESPEYKKALENNIIQMERLNLRDVKPGDVIRLHDGNVAIYLGHFRQLDHSRDRRSGKITKNVRKRYYYLRRSEGGGFDLRKSSSLDVGMVEERAKTPLTDKERFKLVYQYMPPQNYENHSHDPLDYHTVYIVPKKIKAEEVDFFLEPVPDIKNLDDFPYLFISRSEIPSGGKYWATTLSRERRLKNDLVYAVQIKKEDLLQNRKVLKPLLIEREVHKSQGIFIDPSKYEWDMVRARLNSGGPDYEAPLRFIQL